MGIDRRNDTRSCVGHRCRSTNQPDHTLEEVASFWNAVRSDFGGDLRVLTPGNGKRTDRTMAQLRSSGVLRRTVVVSRGARRGPQASEQKPRAARS